MVWKSHLFFLKFFDSEQKIIGEFNGKLNNFLFKLILNTVKLLCIIRKITFTETKKLLYFRHFIYEFDDFYSS